MCIEEIRNLTELEIDETIELVNSLKEEVERFTELYKQKQEKLKAEYESKVNSLNEQIKYHSYNLGQLVKAMPDKKETKTQFKKSYLSGSVIIKKPSSKLAKPTLSDQEIEETFPSYSKVKTELDWANLKKVLKIIDNKVINTETGEDLSDIISIEEIPESYEIK